MPGSSADKARERMSGSDGRGVLSMVTKLHSD
jgi:hypothetical protein